MISLVSQKEDPFFVTLTINFEKIVKDALSTQTPDMNYEKWPGYPKGHGYPRGYINANRYQRSDYDSQRYYFSVLDYHRMQADYNFFNHTIHHTVSDVIYNLQQRTIKNLELANKAAQINDERKWQYYSNLLAQNFQEWRDITKKYYPNEKVYPDYPTKIPDNQQPSPEVRVGLKSNVLKNPKKLFK